MLATFTHSNWFRIFFPLLLVVLAWVGIDNELIVSSSNYSVVVNLPYFLFAVALAIAHIFKQSRIAMVTMSLLIGYFTIQTQLQSPLSTGTTLLELSLLSLLSPIAYFLAYAFKEQGIFSRGFIWHLASIALLFVWSLLILEHFNSGGFSDLKTSLLLAVTHISLLPFILVLYLVALTGISAILVLSKNRRIDSVIYSAILITTNTVVMFHVAYVSSIMFSLEGGLVIIYLISSGHEMAFNDRLTNLPSRRALELDLKHLGKQFTIAMLDIDHFKNFNDTYGHDIGDDVLKLVASRVAAVKGRAKAYRYGGEEFTIVFKGKGVKAAAPFLEDLRADIEQYDMVLRDADNRPKDDKLGVKNRRKKDGAQIVNVTVSIGACDSSSSKNPNVILKSADNALYKAKKGGRNKVAVET
jgi:diguanylate cyclase (GGDEF)-like protein